MASIMFRLLPSKLIAILSQQMNIDAMPELKYSVELERNSVCKNAVNNSSGEFNVSAWQNSCEFSARDDERKLLLLSYKLKSTYSSPVFLEQLPSGNKVFGSANIFRWTILFSISCEMTRNMTLVMSTDRPHLRGRFLTTFRAHTHTQRLNSHSDRNDSFKTDVMFFARKWNETEAPSHAFSSTRQEVSFWIDIALSDISASFTLVHEIVQKSVRREHSNVYIFGIWTESVCPQIADI